MAWFKNKPKNRRLHREDVLEVKLRSDQVRATRVRLLSFTVGITFGTLLGLFVVWRTGQWAMDRLVFENPAFGIRTVEVQTDGVIRPDQLRRWSGVRVGQNLFALDLLRVKRDLELFTAIHSVAVERRLPDTLVLRVTEREAIARIPTMVPRADGRGLMPAMFHMDALGTVFVPLDKSNLIVPPDTAELPVLASVSPSDLRLGRRAESAQVQAALTLLCELDHSPMAGLVSIRQIDCSAAEVLSVQTGQGTEVTFPIRDIERQIRRWRSLYDYGLQNRRAIAAVDLSVGDNIPVRWLDSAPVMPPVIKAKATSRPKKKNV